ncbi:MAG TPA: type II toxin-antitoxin system Phd/YefM family antitoxin [Desulfitobacteriaceae bacterium]|nr:type II toxin-antitoxin system Phd/YefM family antitoxin [Desulfitobacteriaceae bacterium]
MGVVMDNPIRLRPDQMIKASEAAKKFGYARKKAKDLPQFITENGNIDSVLMGYDYYLKMYQRLIELEEKEESRILNERIERLENDPAQGIPWRTIRRSE